MHVIYERCAGLEVHKKTVVACVITPEGQQIRTFRTMTADLLQLADWLTESLVTHVAMESTGIFWKPVYPPEAGWKDWTSPCWCPTLSTSKLCQGAKPMSRTPSGLLTCCAMACWGAAISLTEPNGN